MIALVGVTFGVDCNQLMGRHQQKDEMHAQAINQAQVLNFGVD